MWRGGRRSSGPPHHPAAAPNTPPAVDELKDVAKSLRRLPVVEPGLPTVRGPCVRGAPRKRRAGPGAVQRATPCRPARRAAPPQVALVGAPNVGKSSLVQLLSSGLPEVRDYPFTTRSVKVGHFHVAARRHQVTGARGRHRGGGALRREGVVRRRACGAASTCCIGVQRCW